MRWWPWRRRPGPDELVQDLLDHALKIVRYGIYSGKLKAAKLFAALAAVIELSPQHRTLSERKVVDLKAAVEEIVQRHPLRDTSFAAMPRRWSPRSSVRQSWPFVLLAILLLYWAIVYTSVYSNGEQLVRDLDNLENRAVVEQFGQLELKIFLANRSIDAELRKSESSTPPYVEDVNLNIARSLVYSDVYKLSNFDRELTMMQTRFRAARENASRPFPVLTDFRTNVLYSTQLLIANWFCPLSWERLGICLTRRKSLLEETFDWLGLAGVVSLPPYVLPNQQFSANQMMSSQQSITLDQLCARATSIVELPVLIDSIYVALGGS